MAPPLGEAILFNCACCDYALFNVAREMYSLCNPLNTTFILN